MGKFDGMLICSDWDGTIIKDGVINAVNIEKIRYFQDNGGLFTVCTGRVASYMTQYFDRIYPNTYMISLNGAIIASPNGKNVLYRGYVDSSALKIVDKVVALAGVKVIVIYVDSSEERFVLSPEEYKRMRDELKIYNIHKIVTVFYTASDVAVAKEKLGGVNFGEHFLACSWPEGLDLLHQSNSKGRAVLRLKTAVGAHTLITVGDFENDVDMLQAADISYAVENATDSAKCAATRRTVSVEDGAIAHVINELEQEIDNSAHK